MNIVQNQNLKSKNHWGIEATADYFCQPKNEEELREALIWAKDKKLKLSVLGGGTNVLISDKGIRGLLISSACLNHIEFKKQDSCLKIKAEAGVPKFQLMSIFKKEGLSPCIFLSGLPGDIGGGLIMNAGVSGKNFKPLNFSEIVSSIEVMTSKGLQHYNKEDIEWSYRKTYGWPQDSVILKACFVWPLQKYESVNDQIKRELKNRRVRQPLEWPSCGSVFQNPYPNHAGALIEKAGLKGFSKGGAMISKKHGNFIINKGGATAKDIDHLIKEVVKIIKAQFQISLKLEVHYLGDWSSL